MSNSPTSFTPYVAAADHLPELSPRALILGAFLGVIFGAASTYLALRVGLTTSASVPIAVLAAWALKKKHERRAVLEHNIVQTTGSAGEGVAAAVVFSVPALIFLGYPLQVGLTTLIALTGGILGVLMMVPLRRYLIVKEHGVLRYPEGKACAEIIIAGEKGGTSAKKVFIGLGIGALFKSLQAFFGGVKGTLAHEFHRFRGVAVESDFAPELLGVGYIIGYRVSLMMVGGSILASFILIPLIVLFGQSQTAPLAPATMLIRDMGIGEIWHNYIRHIGAGAVAAGGIFALIKALPSIGSAMVASLKSLSGKGQTHATTERTDRDTPMPVLLGGALLVVAIIWLMPVFQMNLLGAVLILLLGFLFSVVSSRITGEVGSSSSPLSGMTIGVLMATCGVFLLVGWEGPSYAKLALMIGAIVCIAISVAGTCSQDLKTGYLLGSTPIKQQGALLIGVLTSVLAVGWTAYLLNMSETKEVTITQFSVDASHLAHAVDIKSMTDGQPYAFVRMARKDLNPDQPEGIYLVDRQNLQAKYLREDGIGAGKLRAPQAKLMSVVIEGLLNHNLPYDLILLGVAIAIFMELLGISSLTFAVGVYLPIAATMPVFLGGVVRKLADKRYRRQADAEDEPQGTLYSSGLIAGASITGILAAILPFLPGYDKETGLYPPIAFLSSLLNLDNTGFAGATNLIGILLLGLLGYLMFRAAADEKQP